MDKLYELRVYVTHPDMYPVLHEQWESEHFAIYADFHTMLGSFDALNRDGDEAGRGEELGIAVFMEHEDRAAVDASMKGLIVSNRMNEVSGPPGPTIVHHWERTFLYPLVAGADRRDAVLPGPGTYELRTFTYDGESLDVAAAAWESEIYAAFRDRYLVRGLFIAHPESSEMPTGVAVLIRHEDLASANLVSGPAVLGEIGEIDPGLLPTGFTRQLLRPMVVSPMQ